MSDFLDKPFFNSTPVKLVDDQWFIQRQRRRAVRAMPYLMSVDDRGVRCTIYEGVDFDPARRKIRNAYVEVMSAGKIRRTLLYGLLVFIVCSLLAGFLQSMNGGDAPLWTIVPILIWIGVLVVHMLRAQWRATICAALHERHCPGCDYALVDLEESEDGCIFCPECGTAWKLPAVRRVEKPGKTEAVACGAGVSHD